MTDQTTEYDASTASKQIVRYLMEYGERLSAQNETLYRISKVLGDDRNFEAMFHDVGNKGVEEPSDNSMLSMKLTPKKESDVGFLSREYGLTGQVHDLMLRIGPEHSYPIDRESPYVRIYRDLQHQAIRHLINEEVDEP